MTKQKNIFLRYFRNVLVSIDQLINTILFGSPDETLSSRLGKWLLLPATTVKHAIAYWICRFLHILDDHHCSKNIESDEGDRDII